MPLGYRSFHVYQHVTSFSHMRGALVGRRTTAAGFHMQNMSCAMSEPKRWNTHTVTYPHPGPGILNPTVTCEGKHTLTALTNCQICVYICSKKRQNERSREPVC